MKIKVALIGNPNVGKSVVFNNLTGMNQHTGNWPGKTVEKKIGYYRYKGYEFELIDLPGVYSLSTLSDDELVAREYLIHHRPDVVIDVLNASQIERNLYLTLLLIEMQLNLVVVLNMYDVVKAQGDRIDLARLSDRLEASVVSTIATKKEGMEDLKEAVLNAVPKDFLEDAQKSDDEMTDHLPGDVNGNDHLHYHPRFHHHGEYEKLHPPAVKYSDSVEKKLKQIVAMLEEEKELMERFPPRWIALKLLERDEEMMLLVQNPVLRNKILEVTF
ncbi:MAG: FeoB small GTPase domain-containing protein [Candidatus Thorarchaeota archaeon]